MDKLKTALRLVTERVEAKRSEGSVPSFLGLQGMIALVHKEIVDFSKADEDKTQYVINLAAMAVYALSTVLPDMEEIEQVLEDDEDNAEDKKPEIGPPEIDNDPRWSPVAPGVSVADVKDQLQEETDGEDDES